VARVSRARKPLLGYTRLTQEQILKEKKKTDQAAKKPGQSDGKKADLARPADSSAKPSTRSPAQNRQQSRSRLEEDRPANPREDLPRRQAPGRVPLGESRPERQRDASAEGPGDSSSRENLSLVLANNRSTSKFRSQLDESNRKIRVRPKQPSDGKRLPAIKISDKSASKPGPLHPFDSGPFAAGNHTAEASTGPDATSRPAGEPEDAFATSKSTRSSPALKQIRPPRELPTQPRDGKTAKKKKQVVSPYDLEYNNKFLKNTFQLELIMDLEEQRRSRPTEYRIRNFKKSKHLRRKAQPKDAAGPGQLLRAKRSVSPEDRLPEELSSGKSASHLQEDDRRGKSLKAKKPLPGQAERQRPFNLLAEQPKHLRDPLKFSRPFEIKPAHPDRGKKDARPRNAPSSRLSPGPDPQDAPRIRSDDEDAAVLNQTASSAMGRLRPLNKLETPLSRQRDKMYLTQAVGFRPKTDQEFQPLESQRSKGM